MNTEKQTVRWRSTEIAIFTTLCLGLFAIPCAMRGQGAAVTTPPPTAVDKITMICT